MSKSGRNHTRDTLSAAIWTGDCRHLSKPHISWETLTTVAFVLETEKALEFRLLFRTKKIVLWSPRWISINI